jgi:DNA-binding GntR family transcriptional regulator
MPAQPMSAEQIADDIAARIASGEYPPGSALPSYSELADTYSVSRSTASRAYLILRSRGLVTGQAGRGVYIADA